MARSPTSAYLHIPFCRRRCFYCDFPISVVGDRRWGDSSLAIETYVAALVREIELTAQAQAAIAPLLPLQTVFWGGGTPSLLSARQLERLMVALDQAFGLDAAAERAIEMDPGTFDGAQLRGYLDSGINRISLGAQAFQPELLTACGRTHQVADIYGAVDLLHQADVQNFSLDLISGLPHQTLDDWQASLEAAVAIAPAHLSAYDLVIEPGTVFGKRYAGGAQPLPADETAAQMYRQAQATLTQAGYDHYEISNYARPGFQCRHNRVYWQNQPYYGFGMGAAAYANGRRWSHPRTRREYYAWLEAFAQGEAALGEPLTANDELLETLMLGLRLSEGIAWSALEAQFGRAIADKISVTLQPYTAQGWVAGDPSSLRLTDPEGFLFSNTILASLFEALENDVTHGHCP